MSATRSDRRGALAPRRYRLGGLLLESALELPDLDEVTGGTPDCLVGLEPDPIPDLAPEAWFHRETPVGGEVWLEYARAASGYRLRFPGVADFLLLEGGRRIRCHPRPGVPAATLRHLLVQQVVPRLLAWRGKLVLHASAVGVDGKAAAFSGTSGAGKSTLAAEFVRSGHTLLADDMLIMEAATGGTAVPASQPVLRLWPDALAATLGGRARSAPVPGQEVKTAIRRRQEEAETLAALWPLHALFLLSPADPADPIAIDPVSAVDALPDLYGAAFHIDVADRSVLRREFERWSRILRDVPVYRLVAPRSLARLPAIRDRILERLSGRG